METKTFLLISLILISGLSNDFLTSRVGNTTMTVGEAWTGHGDYSSYIKTASFTVTRAASQSYIDFPVQIISSFYNKATAPIWTGMTPYGTIDFAGMKHIKVIKYNPSDQIWYDIPSQISYMTKCIGTYGLVDCSTTDNKIDTLSLYFLDNITTDNQQYQIMYSTDFFGSGEYVFNWNATSGSYDIGSEYPSRVKYQHSTKVVNITEINEIISLTSDFDIENWEVGTGFPSCYDQINSRVMQCTGGTPKLFGITPTGNVDAPLMIETSVSNCNLMALGTGTGYFEADYFPVMTRLKVYTSVDSSIEGPPIVFTATRPGCGFGTTNDYGRSCIQYDNLTYSLFNFNCGNDVAESYNATPTAWGMVGGTTYELCGGYNPVSEYSENPFYFILKNTTSSFDHLIGVKGATSTHYAGGCAGSGYVTGKYVVDEIVSSDRWEVFVSPRTNPSYCTISNGYASFSAFNDIITSETFGGKIRKTIPASSYSVPCATTEGKYPCEQLTSDPQGNLLYQHASGQPAIYCNSYTNSLGFDNICGGFTSCTPCGSCSSDTQGLHCDSACYGYWLINSCGDGFGADSGNAYGAYSCTCGSNLTLCMNKTQDCGGAGCIGGSCLSTAGNSNITFQAWSHLKDSQLNGVTINITGNDPTGHTYSTSCTTIPNSCTLSLAPGRWNFTGSKTGYLTGAEKCTANGATQLNYSQGCLFTVPSSDVSFSLLAVGENPNTTRVTVYTKFRRESIPGALVNMTTYSTTTTTDNNGLAITTFTASSTTLHMKITADGYDAVEADYDIQIGGINSITVLMNKQQASLVDTSRLGTDGKLFDMMILSSKDLIIPFKTTKPGTFKISREDVIVHPCTDWLCTNYKQQGLNVLYVFGPAEGINYVFDNGTVQPYPYEYTRWLMENGNCGAIEPLPIITYRGLNKSLENMQGDVQSIPCTVGDIKYNIPLLTQRPCDISVLAKAWNTVLNDFPRGDPTLLGSLDRFLSAPSPAELAQIRNLTSRILTPDFKTFTGGLGLIVASFTEALSKGKQDILLDYVIFDTDPVCFTNILKDGEMTEAQYNDVYLTGNPLDILINPTYSPLVGRGYDPDTVDSATNGNTIPLKQCPNGIEKQSWAISLTSARTVKTGDYYTYQFRYPTNTIDKDVEFDLQNQNFDTADTELFTINGYSDVCPINGIKSNADVYKMQNYLKVEFTPDDGSAIQVEYIRADIPYRKNSMMLWIWIIGGFAFIIFVMMALTKVYSKIGRRRRRK